MAQKPKLVHSNSGLARDHREPMTAADLRRTWLFGAGGDSDIQQAMLGSGADVLIVDLEDLTPPARRPEARQLLNSYVQSCRSHGRLAAVRINQLQTEGGLDLAAAMPTRPDLIVYPMASSATQMQALDAAIAGWEAAFGIDLGRTEIVPVCETALGVVAVREICGGCARIRCALLGSEDLAYDLCAERGRDGVELDYARRRFVLECRAIGMEPIDAPYTFNDVEGAVREAVLARRLGYRSKSIVRPEHVAALTDVFTPSGDQMRQAQRIVEAFDAARARGDDRVLVEGLWVEVPAHRNACRLIERAHRLGVSG
jgi:citrate lyase subunit beta / citryl-CoA lyase